MARQKECILTAENEKLRSLLQDMLISRALFNKFWSEIVTKLKNRKKFLLDMIERSSIAFNQSDEHMDNYQRLLQRRQQDKQSAMIEMLKLKREIDANDIMSMFLGSKGKNRPFEPLQACEINRRENFKVYHTNQLNFYRNIIEEVKNQTGMENVQKSINFLDAFNKKYFEIFSFITRSTYVAKTEFEFEEMKINKTKGEIAKITNLKDFYEIKIGELTKDVADSLQNEINMKQEIERLEMRINKLCGALQELINFTGCDTSAVTKYLGDNDKMNEANYMHFLALFEKHMNRMIAYVYCKQRDKERIDLLTENKKLIVKSIKRNFEPLVRLDAIITKQHCPECAEVEDVNFNDKKIVKMIEREEMYEIVKRRGKMREMSTRMHTLSACKLPRSGIVAGRRYAD